MKLGTNFKGSWGQEKNGKESDGDTIKVTLTIRQNKNLIIKQEEE